MIVYNQKAITTAETQLGDGSDSEVSRWILHVTALAGVITVKGRIVGSSSTRVAITAKKRADDTIVTSIAATGIYDIDAAGLDVSITAGTSATFDAIPVIG